MQSSDPLSSVLRATAGPSARGGSRACGTRLAPGMKRNCPVAVAVVLALKRVSSVRHTELPAPPICAAAETSERNALYAAMVMVREVVLVEVAFQTCSVTLYVPADA